MANANQETTTANPGPGTQTGTGNTARGAAVAGRPANTPMTRAALFMPLPFMSPFGFLRRFGMEMERLMEDFNAGQAPAAARPAAHVATWAPQIEVTERDGNIVVRADLPGLTKDNVLIEVTDGALAISGERREEHEENQGGFYRTERSYGSFYRLIPLPEGVKPEEATASFNNGVLEIAIPAAERQDRTRTIKIQDQAATGKKADAQSAAGS